MMHVLQQARRRSPANGVTFLSVRLSCFTNLMQSEKLDFIRRTTALIKIFLETLIKDLARNTIRKLSLYGKRGY